jgi:O-antigen ligase
LIQVAQGPSSPLRFFEVTNPTEAVGFFANRNHFAALLYSLTLFAVAWSAETALANGVRTDRKKYETASIVARLGAFTILVVLVAAQAMARSRAGLGLTIVALFGAFAVTLWDRQSGPGVTPPKLLVGAIALAVMFAVQFTLYRILERFAFDPLEDSRLSFARSTIEAARAYMPFGSGIGTFVPVYGMFEKPEDALINGYVNHAHNDVLELWLEGGVVGLGLIGLLAFWLVLRSVVVWRRGFPPGSREVDRSLARAATMIAALLIAHSVVDYPLRTGAMMAIMAFACALLLDPPVRAGSRDDVEEGIRKKARHFGAYRETESFSPALSPTPPRTARSSAEKTEIQSRRPGEWSDVKIEWPEPWRKATKPPSSPANNKPPGSPKTPSD